jgi:hypothetical protein
MPLLKKALGLSIIGITIVILAMSFYIQRKEQNPEWNNAITLQWIDSNEVPISELDNHTLSDLFEDFPEWSLNYQFQELNNMSLNTLFITNNLDLTQTHDMNDLYWKTDGNITSYNNNYYAVGKNLFDFKTPTEIQSTYFKLLEVDNGFESNSNNSSLRWIRYRVGVVENTNYTFSYIANKLSGPYNPVATVADENGNTLGTAIGNGSKSYSFNTGSSNYIDIYFNTRIADSFSYTKWTNIQLELGTTATTYEPLIEPLILINLTDLGISNLTQDRLDYYFNIYQLMLENESTDDIEFIQMLTDYAEEFNVTYEQMETYYQNYYDNAYFNNQSVDISLEDYNFIEQGSGVIEAIYTPIVNMIDTITTISDRVTKFFGIKEQTTINYYDYSTLYEEFELNQIFGRKIYTYDISTTQQIQYSLDLNSYRLVTYYIILGVRVWEINTEVLTYARLDELNQIYEWIDMA